jgi:hypothetical protein
MDTQYKFVQERAVDFKNNSTLDQLADGHTKALPLQPHLKFVKQLSLEPSQWELSVLKLSPKAITHKTAGDTSSYLANALTLLGGKSIFQPPPKTQHHNCKPAYLHNHTLEERSENGFRNLTTVPFQQAQ